MTIVSASGIIVAGVMIGVTARALPSVWAVFVRGQGRSADPSRGLGYSVDRVCLAAIWMSGRCVDVALGNRGSAVDTVGATDAYREVDTFMNTGCEAIDGRCGMGFRYPLTIICPPVAWVRGRKMRAGSSHVPSTLMV